MTHYRNLFSKPGLGLGLLLLAGCSKLDKSQHALPIAGGEIIRCVLHQGVVYAYREDNTNMVVFTEGRVDIYDGGLVIVTERGGTKHCGSTAQFSEITFR